MDINFWGAFCFGIVIGWITYRTLRRSETSGLSDLATVIGALGGAVITSLWKQGTDAFGGYCIGLLIGFFAYLIVALILFGKEGLKIKSGNDNWLGNGTESENIHKPPAG